MTKKIFLLNNFSANKSYISILFVVCCLTNLYSQNKAIVPEKPKLIITVVVQQMRYDYLTRFSKHYSRGGIRKLMYQGTNCSNTQINYAYTQSASGYASISTGSTPANHGIIGNQWFNKRTREKNYAVYDNSTSCIGCKQAKYIQASAKQLGASTYADELFSSSFGKSKVFSIGIEPYSAILMAGQKNSGTFWLDDLSGNWVSSSFYTQQLPSWLHAFNAKKIPDLYIDRQWNTLLPINYYEESLEDNSPFEIGLQNQIEFPYNLKKLQDPYKPYKILKSTPFGITYTKDLAIELIEKEQLGKDEITDYLNISFTPTQEIGDKFGNMSKEVEDAYIRLDYELMFFINYLETYIGKENFLLVLTSNHGVATSAKYELQTNVESGIFKSVEYMYLLEKHLDTSFGEDNWVEYYYAQQIYLNQTAISNKHIPLEDIQQSAIDFLIQINGIQQIMKSTDLQKNSFICGGMDEKIDNSYNQNRSGDLFIQFKPGWTEQSTDVVATHTSGYNYDSHIPLLWYGWKMQAKNITLPISITDIIVSLCNITNTPLPNMANGKNIQGLVE